MQQCVSPAQLGVIIPISAENYTSVFYQSLLLYAESTCKRLEAILENTIIQFATQSQRPKWPRHNVLTKSAAVNCFSPQHWLLVHLISISKGKYYGQMRIFPDGYNCNWREFYLSKPHFYRFFSSESFLVEKIVTKQERKPDIP